MSDTFDPYHKWLGISPDEQPPDHYRLLGIGRFESDGDVIDNAANQRMAHLRTFQAGKHREQSQKLLNEIASARICLLDAEKKLAYDTQLKHSAPVATPPLPAPPVVNAQPGIPTADTAQASTPPVLPERASPPNRPMLEVRPTPKRSRFRRQRTSPWVLPVAISLVCIVLLIIIAVVVFLRG